MKSLTKDTKTNTNGGTGSLKGIKAEKPKREPGFDALHPQGFDRSPNQLPDSEIERFDKSTASQLSQATSGIEEYAHLVQSTEDDKRRFFANLKDLGDDNYRNLIGSLDISSSEYSSDFESESK
ncbi:hypothetical protein HDU91_001739, partial [Kappamyces sp. JEL0680]